MERILLEKLTGSQLVTKFPTFYGTQGFIIAFTRARHLSLCWARSIQSMPPHLTSWRSILIVSSYLCLGLPSDLFPSGFPTKTPNTPPFSLVHATCPVHLILQDIWWGIYILLSSSSCSFLLSTVTSSLLGPNILPSTLLSNTLSLHTSLNMSDKVKL